MNAFSEEKACRFCLHSNEDIIDPLICPCKCNGTVKYVHRECMKKWRHYAPDPKHKTHCQLCKCAYVLPRKWPLETAFIDKNRGFMFILDKPYILILITHYIHMYALNMNKKDDIFIEEKNYPNAVLSPASTKLYVHISLITTAFFLGMYLIILYSLQSRRRYARYFFGMYGKYVAALIASFIGMNVLFFPINILYFGCLSYGIQAHNNVLLRINSDGEDY